MNVPTLKRSIQPIPRNAQRVAPRRKAGGERRCRRRDLRRRAARLRARPRGALDVAVAFDARRPQLRVEDPAETEPSPALRRRVVDARDLARAALGRRGRAESGPLRLFKRGLD